MGEHVPRSITTAGPESFAAAKASLLQTFALRKLTPRDPLLEVSKLMSYFGQDRAHAFYATTTSADTLALLSVEGQSRRRLLLPPSLMAKVVYGDMLEFPTELPRDLEPAPTTFDVVMLSNRETMPPGLAIGLGVTAVRDTQLLSRCDLEELSPEKILDYAAVRELFDHA
jgi:hypothetical protein